MVYPYLTEERLQLHYYYKMLTTTEEDVDDDIHLLL